jgi:hypothetical protein
MGYDEDEEWVLGVLMSCLIAGGAQPSGIPIIRRCSLFVARVLLAARDVDIRPMSRAPRSRQPGTRLTGIVRERRRAQRRSGRPVNSLPGGAVLLRMISHFGLPRGDEGDAHPR